MSFAFAAACAKSTSAPPAAAPEPAPDGSATSDEQESIRSGVTQLAPAVQACYAAAEASQGVAAGKLRLKIAVGENGIVTKVDVLDALQPEVDACAVKAALAVTFPRGNMTFAVPFTLGAKP